MKRQCIIILSLITVASGIFLGSNFPVIKKIYDDPADSNYNKYNSRSGLYSQSLQSDNQSYNIQISGSAYYSDNFDGANDTTSLKSRGYKVYYRGGGIQGVAPVWFQGNFFPSFNGPTTGYLAANYQVISSVNTIDSWLILPGKNVSSGDSLVFYARSDSASVFPDSIRVMYSPAGDSVPEALWTELGRFKAIVNGTWERKAFGVSTPGVNARYAIRYNIVNAGPGGVNGNYIGIDALTLESIPGMADMAAVSVISPSGNISLPVSNIAPKAIFKNIGTTLQSNIPVTFKITGPLNYTSNKIISSLAPNATVQVTFDSTFNPSAAGSYSVSAYSSLLSDGNRFNDTVISTFTSVNTNYGSSAGYFYANSTTESNPAPSKPQFCWKDTTGSINLALNTVNMNPGISTGDLDDGYWKILLPSGKKVRFFGNNYDTVRIGTNGIIAFQSYVPNSGNWNPPEAGIPGGSVLNAVYPLWYDFDFSDNSATSTSRISYKISGDQLIVTYDHAPVYSGATGEYISFQVSINISASPSVNSGISIQYSDTADGRTGQQFINLANSNLLG
nr:choice-of-anchor J domain-containing protein [Ignavibacteria bacterium]